MAWCAGAGGGAYVTGGERSVVRGGVAAGAVDAGADAGAAPDEAGRFGACGGGERLAAGWRLGASVLVDFAGGALGVEEIAGGGGVAEDGETVGVGGAGGGVTWFTGAGFELFPNAPNAASSRIITSAPAAPTKASRILRVREDGAGVRARAAAPARAAA